MSESGWIIIRKVFTRESYSVVSLKCSPCLSSCEGNEDGNNQANSSLTLEFRDSNFYTIVKVETYIKNLLSPDDDKLIFYTDKDKISDMVMAIFKSVYKPEIIDSWATFPYVEGISSMDIQSYFGTISSLKKLAGVKGQRSVYIDNEINEYNSRISKPIKNRNYNVTLNYLPQQQMFFSFAGYVQSEREIVTISEEGIYYLIEAYMSPGPDSFNPYIDELPQTVAYPIKTVTNCDNIYDIGLAIGPYVGRGGVGQESDTIVIDYTYLGVGIIDEYTTTNTSKVPFVIDSASILMSPKGYNFFIIYRQSEGLGSEISVKQKTKYIYNKHSNNESSELSFLSDNIYKIDRVIKKTYQSFIDIDLNTFINIINPESTMNSFYENIVSAKNFFQNVNFFDGKKISIPINPVPNSNVPFIDRYLSLFNITDGTQGDFLTGSGSKLLFFGKQALDFYSFCRSSYITSSKDVPYNISIDRETNMIEERLIKHKISENSLFNLTLGSHIRGVSVDEFGFITIRYSISPSTNITTESIAINTQPKAKIIMIFDKYGSDVNDPDKISKISGGLINVNINNLYFTTKDGFRDFCINYLNKILNRGGKSISANGPFVKDVLNDFIEISSISLDYLGPSQSVSGI